MQIELASHSVELHPSGALFWKKEKVLFIADVHLGKIEHFRKNGSPIPLEANEKNFTKLDDVVAFFSPLEIVFLGDLFHSAKNTSWKDFEAWVAAQEAKIVLVVGNHDLIDIYKFEAIGVDVVDAWQRTNVLGTHFPAEEEGFFNVCGHIHPGFLLKGEGRQNLKLACFYRKKNQLILPAFGGFTGKFLIQPEANEQVYLIGGSQVFSFPH
jgi:DNA ligase-associated metallophosphoesterase